MGECKTPIATIPGVKQVIEFLGLPIGYLKWIYFGIALTVGGAISAVLLH
jgi:hypothetical protein